MSRLSKFEKKKNPCLYRLDLNSVKKIRGCFSQESVSVSGRIYCSTLLWSQHMDQVWKREVIFTGCCRYKCWVRYRKKPDQQKVRLGDRFYLSRCLGHWLQHWRHKHYLRSTRFIWKKTFTVKCMNKVSFISIDGNSGNCKTCSWTTQV